MLNNPQYREEPWEESFRQKLDFFDCVCVVCGHEPDVELLQRTFPLEWQSGKLKAIYKAWPFPEWSYEELPRHLNAALSLAKEQGCDWAIKLDVDTVFHEKDKQRLRRVLLKAKQKGKWVVSIRKLQFFIPRRFWKKGHLPVALDVTKPIAYGFDQSQYTDLCQPIVWDGSSVVLFNGKKYDIPSGEAVQEQYILKTKKVSLFNYDFTFRTYERTKELLYQIEMAHARFWGKGYEGRQMYEISRDTAMEDFLRLSKKRFQKMWRYMPISWHPRFFRQSLRSLRPEQWGCRLWGRL